MELGLKENYKIEKENNKTRQQTKDWLNSDWGLVFITFLSYDITTSKGGEKLGQVRHFLKILH